MGKLKQSNKIAMFWLLITINLITTIFDFVVTYIGTPNLENEGNPLVYTFGLGWKSLIITTFILLIGMVVLLYYTFFKFKRVVIQCKGIKQYSSMLYFNRPDKFIWTFYKFPNNRVGWSYCAAGAGLTLAMLAPLFHLLAIIDWIGVINDYAFSHLYRNLFNIFMTPVARIDFLLGIIILTYSVLYYLFYREYRINKKALENQLATE